MGIAGRTRPRQGGRRGIAALEFGLLAPIFMVSLAGMVDIGNAVMANFVLNASVSAASSFALVNGAKATSTNGQTLATNLATIVANAKSTGWADSKAVVNAGPTSTVTAGVAASSGSAAAADLCYCPTGSASSVSWGASVSCGSTCASGSIAAKFVVITATHQFTPLFTQYGFVPNGTLRAAALVQVQ